MTLKLDNLSDDQLSKALEEIQLLQEKREVRKNLVNHPEVKRIRDEIVSMSTEVSVDVDDILLVGMVSCIEDLPRFVVKVNKKLDEWKKDNATYVDPNNPDNYWYSPDGSGNPPRWIRDLSGDKPKKEKSNDHNQKMELWLESIQPYRVEREQEKRVV